MTTEFINILKQFINEYDNRLIAFNINEKEFVSDITPRKLVDFLLYNENILFKQINNLSDFDYKIHQEAITYAQALERYKDDIEYDFKNKNINNCIRITIKIMLKFHDFINEELNKCEDFDYLKEITDAIYNIGCNTIQLIDYSHYFIQDLKEYLEEEFKQLKISLWINSKTLYREIRAVEKIEKYFLRAYYSPTNPIGKRRLEKSIIELYE